MNYPLAIAILFEKTPVNHMAKDTQKTIVQSLLQHAFCIASISSLAHTLIKVHFHILFAPTPQLYIEDDDLKRFVTRALGAHLGFALYDAIGHWNKTNLLCFGYCHFTCLQLDGKSTIPRSICLSEQKICELAKCVLFIDKPADG